MRFVEKLAAICLLLFLACCALAQTGGLTNDERTSQKLQNITKARELYVLGESQYKQGDLISAVQSWAQALELKPDSTYTKQCLNKAREALYNRYKSEAAKTNDFSDLIGTVAKLDVYISLLPGKKDLQDKRTKLLGQMDESHRTAYDFYREAMKCVDAKDYDNAKSAITAALTRALDSKCLVKAAQDIDKLAGPAVQDNAPAAAPAATTQAKLPIMYDFFATWCGPCKQMAPIVDQLKEEYKGKVDIQIIDIDQNKSLASQYQINAVPTQIIFDSAGKQVFKHVGTCSKETLVAEFKKLGVQ